MEQPVASRHAASLLASLNLQREQAQFCDCVVRQRQTPGQLHPAHRCVLAASSPVLAAILSSTGALVELQPQCLSDTVLSLLLDFIYTGTLPYSHNQHLHYNLLTAASYLQMDELQEALRAWQQTEVKAAYHTNASTGTEDQAYEYVDATLSNMTHQGLTQSISCTAEVHGVCGVDKEVQKYQFHSAGTEEGPERTGEDRRSFSICTAEVQEEVTGRADKSKADNVSSSQCSPPSSSSSSSPSPYPCRGAVPVIRHSSRASMLQLAEVLSVPPPPCRVYQASLSSRLDCSDRSEDLRAVVPLPVQDSDTGSVALYSEEDAKEGHSYTKFLVEPDKQDSSCNLCEPSTDRYPKLRRVEKSAENDRDTTVVDKRRDSPDFCQPVSSTPDPCLDSVTEDKLCLEITEPHMTFTVPGTSEPAFSAVGPSYRGHLQYHCLLQEETHLSHTYSANKHSQPCHTDHSEQSSDDEEVGTSNIPGHSLLRGHFAPGTTNQVLLLDISAKPAELLVADAFNQKETARNGFGNDDRQWSEAASVVGVGTKFWVAETDVEERKDQSSVEGVSNPNDGSNQTITLTGWSPRSVPDSAQASVSSALSVCMPSTAAANISARLSNPVRHPFQCSLCERSFSQRGSLNRHVRSHLGVRPFPCPRCPMTFSRQYRVTEHMRVHQRCVLGSDFQQPPSSI